MKKSTLIPWGQIKCKDCRDLNRNDPAVFFCESAKMTDKARPVFLVPKAAEELHECEHFVPEKT